MNVAYGRRDRERHHVMRNELRRVGMPHLVGQARP